MSSHLGLAPIVESEDNVKTGKYGKKNYNGLNGKINNKNKIVGSVEPFDKNCSPSSSTDSASVIDQQDFEEN